MITNAKHLYVVSVNASHPLKMLKVIYESPDMYLLEDKTVVSKQKMIDAHDLYFVEQAIAVTVSSYIKQSAYPNKVLTNMQAIQNCKNPTSLAIILINMIQALCEEGMPTHEEVEYWLERPVEEITGAVDEVDTYGLEEYDHIKTGDTVFYIEGKNVIQGTVYGVNRNDLGRIRTISVDAPNDFLGISSDLFGKKVFLRKHLAEFLAT